MQRRIALDEETVVVLREHKELALERCCALGGELAADSFVFSNAPDDSFTDPGRCHPERSKHRALWQLRHMFDAKTPRQ